MVIRIFFTLPMFGIQQLHQTYDYSLQQEEKEKEDFEENLKQEI